MTSGHGGYEPGRIVRYNISWMTKGKTQSFLTQLQSADFWSLPTLPAIVVEANSEVTVTLDGAQWIVEGVKDGRYHVVDRQSPQAPDPVRAMGLQALRLGRFRLRAGELY